ncbi:MAG: short-chain dehydrogenase [Arachnia propionica]|nr:MAG: short-chain dehydrogenase [Arachnia propionica]
MATALITGGTSGIGNEFARQLAEQGHDLVLVARDADRLAAVAESLQEMYGVEVATLVADLAERADVMRVAERLEDAEQPIDIFVSNAGFGIHKPLLTREVEAHAKALDVMALAVLILGGAAGRAMKARGRGTIINVSSTAGALYTGHYSAIKAWCTNYSVSLALELAETGVTVTTLEPGWVHTEFHERAGISASKLPDVVWIDKTKLVRDCLADAAKGKVESIPARRWKAAMFLANHGPRAALRWASAKLSNSRRKQ